MYIAMNRFKVLKDGAAAFEERWLNRDSNLHELEGFIAFHMLRGPDRADHILYSSYTLWANKASFEAWTRSPQFQASHARNATQPSKPLIIGHPELECFEVFQAIGQFSGADAQ